MPREVPSLEPLATILAARTRDGEIYSREPGGAVRCFACGHRCLIPEGRPGICKVRFNENGTLRVPWGYVAALQCDPIEKKPFFHVLPGSPALSFGMLGCDYHCAYCQNWITSQAIRDPRASGTPEPITPEQLVAMARRHGAPILASTYNEPLITSEWAVEIFRAARAHGLLGAYISNGNATEEVLDYIRPYVSLYKVDLKSFRDRSYRDLGGTLKNVLDTLVALHRKGFWVEVVTLVVPGFNDSDDELRDIARFLRGITPGLPWHVTAFRKDYKMTDPDPTSAGILLRAAEIGRGEGLQFVYAGNLPGAVGDWENTRCSSCGALLIERHGYSIETQRIGPDGLCVECGGAIPGVWRRDAFIAASESANAGSPLGVSARTDPGRPASGRGSGAGPGGAEP